MLPRSMAMIVAVVGLGLLIAAHEAGHLLLARLMGMRVETYSLGFGPRIFGFKDRSGTDYRISLIPLGGYCKIAGFTPEEHETDADPNDPGSYLNKPAWRRFLVIAAGPAINYLTAFVLLLGLFWVVGVPTASLRLEVLPDGPAARAGMQTGDEVVAIDGVPIHSFGELQHELQSSKEPERRFQVRRTASLVELRVRPQNGRILVGAQRTFVRGSPGETIVRASEEIWVETTGTIGALADLVRHRTLEGLAGPVGIVKQASAGVRRGAADFVFILANISVGLGIFNFLPVPALDGGRLVFLGWEVVTRKRVPHKLEEAMTVVGWLALLALIITVVVFGDFQLGKKLFGR